jgi:hypothetical protein
VREEDHLKSARESEGGAAEVYSISPAEGGATEVF